MSILTGTFHPPQAWSLAKPEGDKPPKWKLAWDLLQEGNSIEEVAGKLVHGGNVVAATTIVAHALQALEHGYPVDIGELTSYQPAPSRKDWHLLRRAEDTAKIDVTASTEYKKKELLKAVLDDAVDLRPWFKKLEFYQSLRRVGFEIDEESESYISSDDESEMENKRRKLTSPKAPPTHTVPRKMRFT